MDSLTPVELVDGVLDIVLVICTPLVEDPELGVVGLGETLLEAAEIVDDKLPVIASAAEELEAVVTPEELIDDSKEWVLVIEYCERELDARVVSSVDRELGIGTVVIEIAAELIDAVSGPIIVPLCVAEIQLEEPVFSGLPSDDDGVIVTVNRREMVVVMNVVVVEVVGGPLLV